MKQLLLSLFKGRKKEVQEQKQEPRIARVVYPPQTASFNEISRNTAMSLGYSKDIVDTAFPI